MKNRHALLIIDIQKGAFPRWCVKSKIRRSQSIRVPNKFCEPHDRIRARAEITNLKI
jgi:hypothetical protein